MSSKQAANDLFNKLKALWEAKSRNLDKCGEYLTQLKIVLAEIGFIPADPSKLNQADLHVVRGVLEIGAFHSIATGNIKSFERYMSQLKHFYFDFQQGLTESAYKYELLGLNLLCLLSNNRLSEFHTELELLSPAIIQANPYIKHPVSLEQYLMEGSYNKVFLSKGNVPSAAYTFFVDILLKTIREEIASCMEKAYKRISFVEACNMLYFKKQDDLIPFSKERNWTLSADKFFHFKQETIIDHESQMIPSNELSMQMLQYAKELEIIV